MHELVKQIGESLVNKGWVMTTAESCTGGLIAKSLTDISGSSRWFDRGFVTYSNQSKIQMLNVSQVLLEEHGAVSDEVVCAMVSGAVTQANVQVGVAVTGIAGPDGGTNEKPVGLVFCAWSLPTTGVISCRKVFSGTRDQIRAQTAEFVLSELAQLLAQ